MLFRWSKKLYHWQSLRAMKNKQGKSANFLMGLIVQVIDFGKFHEFTIWNDIAI